MSATNPLNAQPGRQARVVFNTGRQWQRIGQLLDMANPDEVWTTALSYQFQRPKVPMRLDVLASQNWRDAPLQTIDLQPYLTSTLAGPASMTPAFLPSAQALTPTVVAPDMPPSSGNNGGDWSNFMYRHQEMRLGEIKQQNQLLTDRLATSEQEKRELKEKLDEVQLELRHKDREHAADLRDMERTLRDKVAEDNKPSGLNGLMDAVSNPQHPLAMLAGVMATKLMGPSAADAAGAPPLGGGPARSKNMQDLLNAIADLLDTEEVGAKVYASLSRILPTPDGLQQLLILAGLEQPQSSF